MKCRICLNNTIKIYTTPLLPEYIWPGSKKINSSRCKLYICINCYAFQLQSFTKKKIKSFYGSESFNIKTKIAHKKRLNTIKKKYGKNFFKNKKIIDIGGGINPILNKKSVDLLDFKFSVDDKKNLKNNLLVGDIDKIIIKKKYNIIFLLHTLEHLPYPLKTINKINKILTNDGILFLEVPNFDYYIEKMPHYSVFHQHLNMYVIENLKNLFSFSGLKIEKIFKKKDVIFCSIRKNKNKTKIRKILYKNKIISLMKNLVNQKKKLIQFCNNEKISLLGAGGSAALFLANHKYIKKQIINVYDNSPTKKGKILPGTNIKIKKNKKNNIYNMKTISFYRNNNKNNYNVN